MLAVAMNVLKRFQIGFRGATNLCEVVYSPYQYSFLWDGVSHTIKQRELALYNKVYGYAERLVVLAAIEELPPYSIGSCVGGATHYHRYDISPDWAHPVYGSMTKTCGRIGAHIFYIGK